jgi:ABC-type Fe3+-siderophore transport system permease subunit
MKPLTMRRYGASLGLCALGLFLLLAISPGVGTESSTFGWQDAWRARLGRAITVEELERRGVADQDGDGRVTEAEATGFAVLARFVGFDLRLGRSWLALQVGVTLALCGAVLQVLFRNPLAEPYTLGLAGGGSLGAILCIRFGWVATAWGLSSTTLCAFLGSLTVVATAWAVSRGNRRLGTDALLLGGVAVSLFCGAMMMLVTALSNQRVTFEAIRWMMGSLDPITVRSGATMLPLLAPSWLVLVLCGRALNQFRLGEEMAAARGVNVARWQGVCVLATTLATATVVAQCGPIGFVGLVVPRMVNLFFGSDCRIVFPASALAGGAFLIVCDWGSQWVLRWAGWVTGQELGSATLPIGVVTAVVGVPVFLWLLRSRAPSTSEP